MRHARAQARVAALEVALDASLWDEPTTGIGLYTRCLHAGLHAQGVPVTRWGARRSGERPRGAVGRSLYAIGALGPALAASRAPLYHAVGNFNLPLRRVPGTRLVLTVHDLIPRLFPETVSVGFRWQFQIWLAHSLRVADRVLCPSETTRRDLLAAFPETVDPARVQVVHHGADHVVAEAEADPTTETWLDALGLRSPFVLYVGALDARKNVGVLLEAMAALADGGRRATLVLVGQQWFGSKAVSQRIAALTSRGVDVRPLGYLAAPAMRAVLRRAAVFAFPSRYEGFGLPPLEAMRLGVPTVVSDGGSLPEVCGAGARVVPAGDTVALASALDWLLSSAAERRALAAAGRRRAATFTWERAARKTLDVYRAALGEA